MRFIRLACMLFAMLASVALAPAAEAAGSYAPTKTILVLGAVPQEIPPYVAAMKGAMKKSLWGVDYWQGEIDGKPVVVALTGIGKVNAATVTTLFITTFKPRIALMSGTGSRPNPAVRTGDVIVATELYEHDAGSLTRNDMVYDEGDIAYRPSPGLLAIADKAIASYVLPTVTVDGATYVTTVRRGVVASSDLFGVPEARIQTLRTRFHADIMEMESSAFARACEMLGAPYLVVRGGSNLSQEAPSDDYKRLGPTAAKQAADFGVHLIKYL